MLQIVGIITFCLILLSIIISGVITLKLIGYTIFCSERFIKKLKAKYLYPMSISFGISGIVLYFIILNITNDFLTYDNGRIGIAYWIAIGSSPLTLITCIYYRYTKSTLLKEEMI